MVVLGPRICGYREKTDMRITLLIFLSLMVCLDVYGQIDIEEPVDLDPLQAQITSNDVDIAALQSVSNGLPVVLAIDNNASNQAITNLSFLTALDSGSENIFIGRVGIGTNDPDNKTKLHVVRNAGSVTDPGFGINTIFAIQNTASDTSKTRMDILAGNLGESDICFGDTDAANAARIIFEHNGDVFTMRIAGTNEFGFTSDSLNAFVNSLTNLGNVLPSGSNQFSLGSVDHFWMDLFLGSNSQRSSSGGRYFDTGADAFYVTADGVNTSSMTAAGGADDLGNHTATQDVDAAGFRVTNAGDAVATNSLVTLQQLIDKIAALEAQTPTNTVEDTIEFVSNPVNGAPLGISGGVLTFEFGDAQDDENAIYNWATPSDLDTNGTLQFRFAAPRNDGANPGTSVTYRLLARNVQLGTFTTNAPVITLTNFLGYLPITDQVTNMTFTVPANLFTPNDGATFRIERLGTGGTNDNLLGIGELSRSVRFIYDRM